MKLEENGVLANSMEDVFGVELAIGILDGLHVEAIVVNDYVFLLLCG